jgi:hypothetical protein
LITCVGDFDSVRHSYRDNIVVSAVLTGNTPTREQPPRTARASTL